MQHTARRVPCRGHRLHVVACGHGLLRLQQDQVHSQTRLTDTQTRHTDTRHTVCARVCVVCLLLKVCGGDPCVYACRVCAYSVLCALWLVHICESTLRTLSILTTYSYTSPQRACHRLRRCSPGFIVRCWGGLVGCARGSWASLKSPYGCHLGQARLSANLLQCHQNYLLQKSRLCYLSFGND